MEADFGGATMKARRLLLLSGAVLAGALGGASAEIAPAADSEDSEDRARISEAFGELPLYFVENRGQLDSRVAYYVQGRDTSVFFTSRGVTFALTGQQEREEGAATANTLSKHTADDRLASLARFASGEAVEWPAARQRYALRLDFVGADPAVRPTGRSPTPAVVSYFRGSPDQWKAGLRTYSSLVYRELWPGIDLVYSGTGNRLKYTFEIQPWADADRIRLAYRGGTAARINRAGELEISTPAGRFRDERPYAYQEIDGRRVEVSTRYSLKEARQPTSTTHEYGFRLGRYDRSKPLVVDPAFLVYAGYFGGAGDERGLGIAVDSLGSAYVAGQTASTFDGSLDAYVVKVNAAGTALVYAGFIGGVGNDAAFDITLDAARNAYVTGFTTSAEDTFPVTIGPDLTFNGREDTFVAKVNPAGTALVYAGYIGGMRTDFGEGIAVDSGGNAYVSGTTASNQQTFPETVGPDLTYNGGQFDAFVAKVNAGGTVLGYAGYIGGARTDVPLSRDRESRFVSGGHIALDGLGNAYVSGTTESNEHTFPDGNGFGPIPGPDKSFNGGTDAFVVKVRADGMGLAYAGYIGGAGEDRGFGMAVDSSGNAYVTGDTDSTESTFPVTVGPDLTFNGLIDTFVAKVKGDGTGLVYSGYIGGDDGDQGLGVAIHETASGTSLYVVGHTHSSEATFPVTGGPDGTYNGAGENGDAFVAKLTPVPNNASVSDNYVYNGYIGGAGEDAAFWLDVDGAGNAYVTGDTDSTQATFPDGDGFGSVPGRDRTFNGGVDAFMAKIGEPPPAAPNDNFADAVPIASLPFTNAVSTVDATSEAGEPLSPCASIDNTVWYSFTPGADVSFSANTFGSNYDTVLAAYTGTSLPNLTLVACNDQAAGTNQSRISLTAQAGTTIFFQVGGFLGATGNLTINLTETTPPPNDDFADAAPIASLPFTASLSTVDATSEAGEPLVGIACASIDNTVWYSFTPGAALNVTANTFGSNYNTVLAAYTGTSLTNLTLVACNNQAAGTNQSRISLAASAGTTIFFQVSGFLGATGNLTFNVTEATPPPNDNFADAAPIASVPFTASLSTVDATFEIGESSYCGGLRSTVWYSYTPAANVTITANTFGSNYDTALAAWTGTSLSNLTLVDCGLNVAFNPLSRITFAAQAGTTIFFQVGADLGGEGGNLTFNVTEAPPPPNDNFADAAPIASLPFTVSLSTAGATSEVGESASCSGNMNTVWYSFTPATNVTITANTLGSNYDTVLAAWTGTSLSNLTLVACNNQFGGTNQSQITFAAQAGTTIFFQVGGFFGASGNLTFNVTQAP